MTLSNFKFKKTAKKYVISDCGTPSNVPHSTHTLDSPGKTTVNSTTTYKCLSGYEILGTSMVSCLENGTWGTTPTCQLRGKTHISFKPTQVIYSKFS